MKSFKVGKEEIGRRLDAFLVDAFSGTTRGTIKRLLADGKVRINGRIAQKGDRLNEDDSVEIELDESVADDSPVAEPERSLTVLLRNDLIVAVNKVAGEATFPLRLGERGTAANALVARYPECVQASERAREGGFVHRLDRDTTGVLVAARRRDVYQELNRQFVEGMVTKSYLALVTGEVEKPLVCDLPLRPLPGRERMQALPDMYADSVTAHSEVVPRERFEFEGKKFSLVQVNCRTGRRHQVRVHLSALSHPIVGDPLYGGATLAGTDGTFLHGQVVSFGSLPWPELNGLSIEAPLPENRNKLLDLLRVGKVV